MTEIDQLTAKLASIFDLNPNSDAIELISSRRSISTFSILDESCKLLCKVQENGSASFDSANNVVRECKILKALPTGPWPVVKSEGYLGNKKEHFFFTQEYSDSLNLFECQARADLSFASGNGGAILEACHQSVTTLNNSGIVHGDLQPKHFLVDPQTFSVTLVDFGCAVPVCVIDQGDFKGGMLHFSTPRMARERLARGNTTGNRSSDVYALLASVYFVVTNDFFAEYGKHRRDMTLDQALGFVSSIKKDHVWCKLASNLPSKIKHQCLELFESIDDQEW